MTTRVIRRLNDRGIDRLRDFLLAATSASWSRSVGLLDDPETSAALPCDVHIDGGLRFATRHDLAAYLYARVPRVGLADPTRDRGLWTWLSLLWFEQLARLDEDKPKVGEIAKWIPQPGWKYYRHLVLGPYLIYAACAAHPARAMALLHNPPHTPGELVGQLAATQDVAQSPAAIEAATELYYDPSVRALKRGSGGRGPGSPSRYRMVLDQLNLTFDLQSLTGELLLELLPAEFDRFKAGKGLTS